MKTTILVIAVFLSLAAVTTLLMDGPLATVALISGVLLLAALGALLAAGLWGRHLAKPEDFEARRRKRGNRCGDCRETLVELGSIWVCLICDLTPAEV